MSRATFTRMEDSTAQDWRVIGGEFAEFSKKLPDRVKNCVYKAAIASPAGA